MSNKAVLVGVNQYQNYPQDELKGCVNDMNNLWVLLVDKMHFEEAGITLLKDSQATARAEKDAVRSMIQEARPGDHLIWSHSSHGSNNPDAGQKDGLQELLCSYDLTEKNGIWDIYTCITAAWIGEVIAQLHSEASLDILLDCCYAPEGSQLKEIGRSYNRAKWLPRSQVGRVVTPQAGMLKDGRIPNNVALWAACGSNQTSTDAYIGNTWQGAFTAAFLQSWHKRRTRADIISVSRLYLKSNGYQQVARLYCRQIMALKSFGD